MARNIMLNVRQGKFFLLFFTVNEKNLKTEKNLFKKRMERKLMLLQKIMKHMKGTVQGQETDNSQKNNKKTTTPRP